MNMECTEGPYPELRCTHCGQCFQVWGGAPYPPTCLTCGRREFEILSFRMGDGSAANDVLAITMMHNAYAG